MNNSAGNYLKAFKKDVADKNNIIVEKTDILRSNLEKKWIKRKNSNYRN